MHDTRQKILDVSLDLFSKRGFSAVSIRDICAQVMVKESTIYYHFKNKQAILDELIRQFEKVANSMMTQLEQALGNTACFEDSLFYQNVCDTFFENYLMDDFCNKVMRLLLLEQFNNEDIHKVYDTWMFSEPLKFQSKVFDTLIKIGIIKHADSTYLAVKYYSPIYLFSQKWLLTGTLSEGKKNDFRAHANQHIKNFFAEIEEKPCQIL